MQGKGGFVTQGITHSPYDWKSNERDRKEIALINAHMDDNLTESEWMQLCNRFAGFYYDKIPKGQK